jgi:hypothetical protein
MSETFDIRPANRKAIKPLIAMYSESGCGKTYSSLLLARGFVGPAGKIAMIDTESGRGELYADVLPGGYDVLPLVAPYHPSRYSEALARVTSAGYNIVVVDSGSHEWEGTGGVLDLAAEIEERTKRPGLHCWRQPKMEHAKFILSLLQSPITVIVCLRAKYKSRQTKNDQGKTAIVKDEWTSPIQSEEFIFESTIHGEIMPDHSFRLTKCSHPALKDCFPVNTPITVTHGEKLAAWCEGAAAGKAAAAKPANERDVTKRRLWDATKSVHGGDAAKLAEWLAAKNILPTCTKLADLEPAALAEVLEKAKIVMGERGLL